MIITPHVLTSLLITTNLERLRIRGQCPNRSWASLLLIYGSSFVSHFLLDYIPHFDYSIDGPDYVENVFKVSADLLFAFVFFAIAFRWALKLIVRALNAPIGTLKEPAVRRNLRYLPLLGVLSCGIFSALLPDIIVQISKLLPVGALIGFTRLHDLLHSRVGLDAWQGLFVQAVFCLFVIFGLVHSAKNLERDRFGREIVEETELWLELQK